MAKSPYVRSYHGERTSTLFDPPGPPTQPPVATEDDPDESLAVLDRAGCRADLFYKDYYAVRTPVIPSSEMIEAFARLDMNLAILFEVKHSENLSSFYELLPRGWLYTYKKDGMRRVEEIIRNNVTLMPADVKQC